MSKPTASKTAAPAKPAPKSAPVSNQPDKAETDIARAAPALPTPAIPADIVNPLVPMMQRVELTGDEAYAYVKAMEYLRSQQALYKAAAKRDATQSR